MLAHCGVPVRRGDRTAPAHRPALLCDRADRSHHAAARAAAERCKARRVRGEVRRRMGGCTRRTQTAPLAPITARESAADARRIGRTLSAACATAGPGRSASRAIPDMRSRLALHRLSADALVQRGVLLNAKAALEKLGCSGAELEVIHRLTKSCAVALLPYSNVGVCWQRCCGGASAVVQAKWRANGPLKLGPGLYVSHVDADGVGLYIVNGPPLTRAERPSSAGSAATCRSLHRLGAIALRSLIDRGCGHIAPTCAASAPAVLCCESPAGVAGRDAAVDVGSLSGFYMAMREKFTTAGAQAPPLPSLLGPTRRG